ncbi:MAG TPA: FGGY-family carbohydrate kinase [Acetobacteraceae bacterium]|nr:FGGY-family carbohydrate kinase [Acetobacteraceae bacterium]
MRDALIGVDVGTGSARAAVFDVTGRRLGYAARPIATWQPAPDFAEQSSADIWSAVCAAVREAIVAAGPVAVRGIGFDATCSLVVLDAAGAPVSVAVDGAAERDVILWMDHRATAQAARINATCADVLRYVGGSISPEMQTPKLLWLKEGLPQTWHRAAHFLDLPDFLTWRATGALSRSLCSTVCKWTYLGHEQRWDGAFFHAIGLGDLADEGFRRIGTDIRPLGAAVGDGLSARAAAEFGLAPGTPVGVSAIDAHAGGIGAIGAALDGIGLDADTRRHRLVLVGGTSSCHMAVSAQARFVPGVWGPYFSAMIPGLWLNEGGQSATGALLDHLVRTHPAAASLSAPVFDTLNARLAAMARSVPFRAALSHDLHVFPDFHGNRSPRADPTLRGMISGLSLGPDADDLARLYLATMQAIAYGTRHIIAALDARGYAIDTVLACGGHLRNPVLLAEHADATGCRIAIPEESEAVLLGAATLGAVAGGCHPDLAAAMRAMTRVRAVIEPAGGAARSYHDAKYAVFQRMHDDQIAYRALMGAADSNAGLPSAGLPIG